MSNDNDVCFANTATVSADAVKQLNTPTHPASPQKAETDANVPGLTSALFFLGWLLVIVTPSLVSVYNGDSVSAAACLLPISLLIWSVFVFSLGHDMMDVVVGSALFLIVFGIAPLCFMPLRDAKVASHLEAERIHVLVQIGDHDSAIRQRAEHRAWVGAHASARTH